MNLKAFKAYDVRGKVPDELNEDLVYKIGLAYANEIQPQGPIVTGRDIRDSSPMLQAALNRGLLDGGCDVIDAGLCGTETIYFASSRMGMGGGLMVTASHNPKGYNGIKPVGARAKPLTGEKGLSAIRQRIELGQLSCAGQKGSLTQTDYTQSLIDHYFTIIPAEEIHRGLKLVANPGNGCAGPTAKRVAEHLGLDVHWVHFNPDPQFPNGVPNPLLTENRSSTASAVLSHKADLGMAWDGDFDRCFFFDDTGDFIEGYYLVGLLAEAALARHPGAAIIHDPRLYWNTIDIVEKAGGRAVMSQTGHAYIKDVMRKENAIYGGEMSAHHYFRDFSYCDSGMLPWLMLLQVLKARELSLSDLVRERMELFPCSGEINFSVNNTEVICKKIKDLYLPQATSSHELDGLSLDFNDQWRFNLRASNTEPLLRLNVESRGDEDLMEEKTHELSDLIQSE